MKHGYVLEVDKFKPQLFVLWILAKSLVKIFSLERVNQFKLIDYIGRKI